MHEQGLCLVATLSWPNFTGLLFNAAEECHPRGMMCQCCSLLACQRAAGIQDLGMATLTNAIEQAQTSTANRCAALEEDIR